MLAKFDLVASGWDVGGSSSHAIVVGDDVACFGGDGPITFVTCAVVAPYARGDVYADEVKTGVAGCLKWVKGWGGWDCFCEGESECWG